MARMKDGEFASLCQYHSAAFLIASSRLYPMARQEEIARNALAEGISTDIIQKITGLDTDTIKKL